MKSSALVYEQLPAKRMTSPSRALCFVDVSILLKKTSVLKYRLTENDRRVYYSLSFSFVFGLYQGKCLTRLADKCSTIKLWAGQTNNEFKLAIKLRYSI